MDSPIDDPLGQRLRMALDGAEVERLLEDGFVSSRDGSVWWMTPHPLMNGAAPYHVAETEDGLWKVRQLLIQMRYGASV